MLKQLLRPVQTIAILTITIYIALKLQKLQWFEQPCNRFDNDFDATFVANSFQEVLKSDAISLATIIVFE